MLENYQSHEIWVKTRENIDKIESEGKDACDIKIIFGKIEVSWKIVINA